MSWYIKTVGSPAAIKAAVAKETYMPQAVKDSIGVVCDKATAMSSGTIKYSVLVESQGHISDYGAKNHTVCEALSLAPEPEPDPVLVARGVDWGNGNPDPLNGAGTAAVETKVYSDGTEVTGPGPLPAQSPAQQDAQAGT